MLLQIIKYLQIPAAIPLPVLEERGGVGVEVRFLHTYECQFTGFGYTYL
jgi:hypothetical protein